VLLFPRSWAQGKSPSHESPRAPIAFKWGRSAPGNGSGGFSRNCDTFSRHETYRLSAGSRLAKDLIDDTVVLLVFDNRVQRLDGDTGMNQWLCQEQPRRLSSD